jgi:hypothetical protein
MSPTNHNVPHTKIIPMKMIMMNLSQPQGCFFSQFCQSTWTAIIHKRNEPNLPKSERSQQKYFSILPSFFGDLPGLIIEIGQLLTLFFFKIW